MPPVTGMPSSTQASLSPRQASANCHITAGSSGEPKLRQSLIGQRPGAAGRDVAVGLGQRELGAGVRVEPGEPAVAVGRDRDAEPGLLVDADHAAVAGLGEHGVAPDVAVVLVGDPRLVAEVGAGGQPQQRSRAARRRSPGGRAPRRASACSASWPVGPGERAVVGRAVVRHRARRYVDDPLAVPVDLQPAGVGDLADDGRVDVPLRADRQERGRRRRARRPPSSAPATRSSGSPRARAWSRAAAPGRARRACRRRRRWRARRWRRTARRRRGPGCRRPGRRRRARGCTR